MFAVIRTGGQQYKVREGGFICVEKLPYEEGASVEIPEVLMVGKGDSVAIGRPFVPGSVVQAKVVEQKKLDTILVFKKHRRKNYRRKNGHRQPVTVLKIESIVH
ncbi:MAG: 50S ribosomal protein L21 [Holosporaceae bacterium]|jgi:large subunit ribosomal protein L21|nr:50S ribosomal protein L21 [Holosporaceae bacterium]